MPTCYQIVPARFEDGRHLAMEAGARAAGYTVHDARNEIPHGRPGDVLMTWNLHGVRESEAAAFRAAGGEVIVWEEGYTRYLHPVKHFAAALDGHNGSGRWFPDGPHRWRALGLDMAPWRADGDHILVCGQRGIGARAMASPAGWHDDVARRLRKITDRPVVVRPHPGKNKATAPPLEQQIAGAWAVVVWSSASALRALLMGVPVFYEAPHHVLEEAMTRGVEQVERPPTPDRLEAMERMAWAQWSMDEIAAGEPFRHLLRR